MSKKIKKNNVSKKKSILDRIKGDIKIKITPVKVIVLILAVVAYISVLYFANQDRPHYTITKTSGTEYETAKVLNRTKDDIQVDKKLENIKKGSTMLEVEILTGRYKGDVTTIKNYYSALYNVDVKKGDTLSVRIDTTGLNKYQVSVYNYNRIPFFYGMIILFFLVLVIIGGKQGLSAFVGLAFTIVSIFFILLPLSLKGFDTVSVTCILVLLTSAVCYYMIGGWQPKTITAALGCFAGVIIAAFFGWESAKVAGISTFQTNEAEALMLAKSTFDLHMRGMFVSGILIAAMGAVMDVSMTISSALSEIHTLNPERTFAQLAKSGMSIGRDAMGTMANTLVLAYVGSSFNMMVVIFSYGVSFTQLVNTDFVAVEMIRSIAGSLGIFFTVPATSIIGAFLLSRKKK